ncbi:hypothetical protein PENTCL1PPCAC_22063, partial [Pristionchus entomophagus]
PHFACSLGDNTLWMDSTLALTPPSLPKCCELFQNSELKQRHFKFQSFFSNEDLISTTLPDDCLISISEYLNHDDLDIMACVSQKMNAFAKNARPKTNKIRAKLQLVQMRNGDIEVNMIRAGKGVKKYRLKFD